MRVDVRRDNSYAWRRAWTPHLPTEPAAVMLYDDKTKLTRCLAADFDIKEYGAAIAAVHAGAFVRLIEECGGQAIMDRSPSGGLHVYMLLATPRHVDVITRVMSGLKAKYPTLDIGPMCNSKTGSIRPPGAAHRRGNHQMLVTSMPAARRALINANGDLVWRALMSRLGPVGGGPARAAGRVPSFEEFAKADRWQGRKRWLKPEQTEIARTGQWDRAAHPGWTPSEARQSVVGGAFRRGWLLPEVVAQMEPGGAWQGLLRLYPRAPAARLKLVRHDWWKAEIWTREQRDAHRTDRTVHSARPPRGGELDREFIYLREWWTGMRLSERSRDSGRDGLTRRLALRAMGAAAQGRGSRYVQNGVRCIGLGAGVGRDAAARALKQLREEDDPRIALFANNRGEDRPDIYELRIPDVYADEARTTPWRRGRFEPIHHAFRELGTPAAFVYEALGEYDEALSTSVLAEKAIISRRAAELALRDLGEFGLAERGPGGWRRGPSSLDHVGEELGTREEFERQVLKYRQERLAFRKQCKEHAEYMEPLGDRWATGVHEPPDDFDFDFEPDDVVIKLPEEAVIVLPAEADHEMAEALELLEREVGAVALPP